MGKNVVESMREHLYRRDPVFSFEFFPPKDEKGAAVLERSLDELSRLNPAFVSVTCGAGGSSRTVTRDLVLSMQGRYGFGVMAHITAVGRSRRDLAELVADYRKRGIMNFLALRGDPPRDAPDWRPPSDQAEFAAEVVAITRRVAPDASIGVAGYPETHPRAESPDADLRHLAEKVAAGADFVVTQLFFNNDNYFDFIRRARKAGIKVPILPGIMPVTRPGQVERFRELCGVETPPPLQSLLADEELVRADGVGIAYAAAQTADLLRRGACGIHLYTLNQSRACHTLFQILTAMGW